jgi:protein-S-isoprenylcysteine O-methyltransferase Ste14
LEFGGGDRQKQEHFVIGRVIMILPGSFLKWIFKNRGVLMVPPIIFAVLCTWSEIESDLVACSVGGALFITGMFLRIWTQMHLHYRLNVSKVLTTTGPYSYVRNPVYIGNTIMLVGVVIISRLLWFAPAMLVYCAIVYNLAVRFEETRLLAKYGNAYAEYLIKVPRWVPRWRSTGIGAITDARRFLASSLLVESSSLLLLLPFIIKRILV